MRDAIHAVFGQHGPPHLKNRNGGFAMKEPDRTIVSLGSFEVVSEELVVADPCRAPGTGCMGRL